MHVTYRELKSSDVEGGSVIGGALGDLGSVCAGQADASGAGRVSGELHVGGAGWREATSVARS